MDWRHGQDRPMGEAVVRSTSADLHYFGPAGRTMPSSHRLLGFAAIEKSPG